MAWGTMSALHLRDPDLTGLCHSFPPECGGSFVSYYYMCVPVPVPMPVPVPVPVPVPMPIPRPVPVPGPRAWAWACDLWKSEKSLQESVPGKGNPVEPGD